MSTVEDNVYCEQLLQDYLNDPDPHKHDSVSLEEAMKLCGVTADEIKALEELEYMEKHPEEFKSYNSVDEMFDEILAEDDESLQDDELDKSEDDAMDLDDYARSLGYDPDELKKNCG